MTYSLLIDVVVALLLVVTIGYAIRLNKRLGSLRRDKSELEKLASTFAESTIRADDSLGRLRATADMMQMQIDRAQGLHDDLAFLLDRGEKAADRLEDAVRDSRDVDPHPKLSGNNEAVRTMSPVSDNHGVSDNPKPVKRSAPDRSRNPVEIDDINAGMTRPAPKVSPRGDARDDNGVAAQTEAERELLKALRSGN